MATLTEIDYVNEPYKKYTNGCIPGSVAYGPSYDRQWVWHNESYLLPQSRPKPDNLIMNMTALPMQYTIHRVTGRSGWYRTGVQNDYTCSPYKKKEAYQRVYWWPPSYPDTAHLSAEAGWPDWSLPLRLKIKDDVINLGATLAEYRESVRMFGSAAIGIRDAVRSIRKLKFMKRRSLCSVTNAHLIYDYGVAPLMSDMFDTWEALRLRLERPIYKRYGFSQRLTPTVTSKVEVLNTECSVDVAQYTNGKQRIAAYVELDREKAKMFTLGNPLEIAWELVPFSFAIDWFIPIGDTLIALDALKAVENIRVSVTQDKKREVKGRIHAYDKAAYGGTYRPQSVEGYSYQQMHERLVYDSVPLPPLPRPALSGSVNRLFNALSLLVSVRGCKGRMPRFRRPTFKAGDYTE